jgi:hypothetical protein
MAGTSRRTKSHRNQLECHHQSNAAKAHETVTDFSFMNTPRHPNCPWITRRSFPTDMGMDFTGGARRGAATGLTPPHQRISVSPK